jgi:LEA14-like dessication related protein
MAAGLFIVAGPALAGAGPRLEIPQPIHDLGEIFEDQPLAHTFMLKNVGDVPLQIKNIELDCACSAVNYDRLIPPGETGKIVFTIKPYSAMHKFCKKGAIFSNDPGNSVATIQLCGNAKPFIDIQPSHVVRFSGQPHDNLVSRVRLISHQKTPLTIKGFETDLGDKVGVKIKEEKPGQIFEVEITNRMKETGAYKGKIEILTSSDKRPKLILRIFGDLYPSGATAG